MRINLKRVLTQNRLPEHLRDGAKDLRAIGEQLVSMQFQGLVFGKTFSRDACAGYLADHLDAALELAEQIAEFSLGHNQETVADDVVHSGPWIMGGDAIVVRFADVRAYVHKLKTLELAFTSKISQARIWAERVQRYDPRLDRVAGLLLSGTHTFIDAGAGQADTTMNDFDQSDPTLVYLRSRGLIDETVVSLDQVGTLTPGYNFKIWGGVTLYDIAEMMNVFLGAADVHYSLYEPDEDAVEDTDSTHAALNDHAEAETRTENVDRSDDAVNADESAAADAESEVKSKNKDGDDLAEPVAVMGTEKSGADAEANTAEVT